MTLCIAAGGTAIAIAASSFTLSWVHSVERTRWDESWRIAGDRLEVVEAHVQGAGAGIDLPDDAERAAGGWRFRPRLAPIPRLVLAASGATPSGWTLCAAGSCRELGAEPGQPIEIRAAREEACGPSAKPKDTSR